MIKQLPQRPALMGSPPTAGLSVSSIDQVSVVNLRLGAIDGVEGLVQEKSDGKGEVDPRRHVLVHRGIIPQHGQKIDNDEAKARQGDLGSSRKIRGE